MANKADKRYGMYDAIVVDVTDPLLLDRVKVRVFEVLGDLTSPWVFPASTPPHWSWKPAVGDRVLVQYRAGDVDRPMYWGTWYPQDGHKISTVPQESRDEYPFHRMIQTPQGHKIEFKDISTERNANTGQEDPIEDSTQYVKISTVKGNKIEMIDTKDAEKISVETPAGHKIEMDDANTTLSITHSSGTTKIEIDSGGKVTITADGDVDVAAVGAVNLVGGGGSTGLGVVTKAHICAFTGAPHPDGSGDVTASQ